MQVWSQAKLVNVDPSSPASVGIPRSLRKNYSIYAVADQLVYRPAGAKEGGIGLFARVMGAPGDRNLSNFLRRWRGYLPGCDPGRPDDTFGVGLGYARISSSARALEVDTALFSGTFHAGPTE
ncbi:MAG: carbohydrate porin [Acetobacteraceae bacterium]|nr:carbohydrate porin [Acetobacteraceae bacterium]